MITIKLEEWQVKNLRNYFGENDKTQTEHWAYDVFNNALKKQCDIPVVVGQSEQFTCKNPKEQCTFFTGGLVTNNRSSPCDKCK